MSGKLLNAMCKKISKKKRKNYGKEKLVIKRLGVNYEIQNSW